MPSQQHLRHMEKLATEKNVMTWPAVKEAIENSNQDFFIYRPSSIHQNILSPQDWWLQENYSYLIYDESSPETCHAFIPITFVWSFSWGQVQ